MVKINDTVKRETVYIAYSCTILSVLMQAGFIFLKKWDYTVLLGNMWSLALGVFNFLVMGITVQNALEKGSSDAKSLIKASQGFRNAALFVLLAVGVIIPFFNTVAVIIPIFFPRIAVSFRPFIKDRKGSDK